MTNKKNRPSPTLEKKKLTYRELEDLTALTDNQEVAIKAFEDDYKHLVLSGCAGTGKTYLAVSMALREVLKPDSPYRGVMIIRSAVPTRDMGHLPGDQSEKGSVFFLPYKDILDSLASAGWNRAVSTGLVQTVTTSYVRGQTWDNMIIVVDEMQNMSFHELDSIFTRLGLNSRIIFSGDWRQSDLLNQKEREGLTLFIRILRHLSEFEIIDFTSDDIVRSDIVRDYIIAREKVAAQDSIK